MKDVKDMTEDELFEEHSAAYWFHEGSDDPDQIKGAGKRIEEIENEWARRKALKSNC